MKATGELASREAIIRYGKRMLEEGLVQGTWGNLSVRLSPVYMLTTPSGRDYNSIRADDTVKVDIKTLTHENGKTPTSEKAMHAVIYEAREDVGAIIHTHSTYASIFAASGKPLQIMNPALREVGGELVYIADYGPSGSRKLAQNVIRALGPRHAVILFHHGMLAVGADIEEAFRVCRAVEQAAKEYIDARY